MKERPILFSGPMVRAILEGRKTQTRRVVKPQPAPAWTRPPCEVINGRWASSGCVSDLKCPYGVPGDRLWVKEKHVLLDRDGWCDMSQPRDAMIGRNRNGVGYADNEKDPDSERCRRELGYSWRPSIHMPRWASRLTLEVVSVRVERVREISEADAKAEGVRLQPIDCVEREKWRTSFEYIWQHINGKTHPWSSNPWVWVVEFKRVPA
jgi:hypothetical protein